jgi:hypothetical protein
MLRLQAWRWRISKALLAGVVKTGWKGWARERIFVAQDRLRPLANAVRGATGESKPVFAILLGVPGLYRKLTVLAMSPNGKTLGYIKLPLTDAAGGHVRHEAEVLHELGEVAGLRGNVPTLLHSQEWQNGCMLFQSGGAGKRGPTRFTGGHERFLRRLWEARPVQKSGQVLVDEVGRRWQEVVPRLTSEERHAGELALQKARKCLDGVAVRCGLMHGDFAPVNTLLQADGELFVFDWEWAEFDQPIIWDVLHFHARAAVMCQEPEFPMNWAQFGSGDLATDKGLLLLYCLDSLSTLLIDPASPTRATAYHRRWLEKAVADEVI